jgi:beta-lactamase regulating signal transducer with metallopeptidase domain
MSERLALELVSLAVKTSLVVAVALAATSLMRKHSAAARHWMLSLGILCAIAIPLARATLPAWSLPQSRAIWTPSLTVQDSADASSTTPSPQADSPTSGEPDARGSALIPSSNPLEWSSVLLSAWAAGTLVVLFALGTGLVRLAWLSSRSTTVVGGAWREAASSIAATLGLRSVRLLQSRHPSLLAAWGWRRPTVLLPALACSWQEDRIRAVLAHELAHLRRRDWPIQIAAELLRAISWFNPLIWIACGRLRRESEQACDDVVLGLGIDVTSYANHLVDIARALNRRAWLPAPAMARPSSLEWRIAAMLNRNLRRRPLTRRARLATSLLLPIVAISTASAQSFVTLSGTVSDPTDRMVPNATVVLTNERTNATYTVNTDESGRYEFVGLVPGTYQVQSMLPGFAPLKGRLTLAAQDVRQDMRLEVGTLQETISVVSAPDAVPEPAGPDRAAAQSGQRRLERRA